MLKQDVENMGIIFGTGDVDQSIYIPGDNEHPEFRRALPVIQKICEELGWRNIYSKYL